MQGHHCPQAGALEVAGEREGEGQTDRWRDRGGDLSVWRTRGVEGVPGRRVAAGMCYLCVLPGGLGGVAAGAVGALALQQWRGGLDLASGSRRLFLLPPLSWAEVTGDPSSEQT